MKFYAKIVGMFVLLLFMPPLGLLFMYKFSPFNRRENFLIAVSCIGFFLYANYDLFFTDQYKKMPYELTAEEFREKFNSKSEELAHQLQLKIDNINLEDNKFEHTFNKNLILSGKLFDNNNISAIEIFANPQNQDESFQAIVCIGLIISVLNPELDQDARSEVFSDLKMFVDKSVANMNESTSRGNIEYNVRTDNDKKVFFSAKIKK